MLTGRRVDAAEADRIGFVTRVVPVDELDAAVDELAAELAGRSPLALQQGRDSFYAVWDQEVEASLRLLHPLLTITASTDDAAEGIAAFTEKRPPSGRGASVTRRRRQAQPRHRGSSAEGQAPREGAELTQLPRSRPARCRSPTGSRRPRLNACSSVSDAVLDRIGDLAGQALRLLLG